MTRSSRALWVGVGAGVIYGVVIRLLFTLDTLKVNSLTEIVSLAFIFVMPTVMGAITVAFGDDGQIKRYSFRIFAPWLTIAGFYAFTLITALETFICLVMLFPAYAVASSAGGLLAGWGITFFQRRQSQVLGCFALLPFLLAPIEGGWPTSVAHHTVSTEIVVDADSSSVWRTIKSVPNIQDDELRWSFSHGIGIPRPRAALLNGEGTGSVRDIYWERGIHFREIVTSWEEGKAFAYRVDATPAAPALRVLDTHVVIGDKYFDVIEGGYTISEAADGKTLLTLRTTYRISTRLNFYGKFWANLVLDDFHGVVLEVIKNRARLAAVGSSNSLNPAGISAGAPKPAD